MRRLQPVVDAVERLRQRAEASDLVEILLRQLDDALGERDAEPVDEDVATPAGLDA